MTTSTADFFKVPPATGAAPNGCIRVTILNRRKRGLTMIYRLDDLPKFMEGVESTIDLETDTPVEVMKALASVMKAGTVPDDDAPFLGMLALWVARKSDEGISNAIDVVAKSTGRVALLVRERKGPTAIRASWDFLVGVEKGTNEMTPVGHA